MNAPFFYVSEITNTNITLDEPTSRYITAVLRMKQGEEIFLTNGKGIKVIAVIVNDNRKKCIVEITATEAQEEREKKITIGISLIKNTSRFEWFLEKATEIGVSEIIPLICERTEKEKFRFDRMKSILVSAMLQSQQSWLPVLHEPTNFADVVKKTSPNKFIAHCQQQKKPQLSEINSQLPPDSYRDTDSRLILIGPEGDFTENEISLALENNFVPVALGPTRLRTETAGIVAGIMLKMCRHEQQ